MKHRPPKGPLQRPGSTPHSAPPLLLRAASAQVKSDCSIPTLRDFCGDAKAVLTAWNPYDD